MTNCLHVHACTSECVCVSGCPRRVAKLRAASSSGLSDGDLAASTLCALRLPNKDFRAGQQKKEKLVNCCAVTKKQALCYSVAVHTAPTHRNIQADTQHTQVSAHPG